MSQVELIVFIFMYPNIQLYFRVKTLEYFASLAAGNAAGAFDRRDLHSPLRVGAGIPPAGLGLLQ